jgi:leader peptidase (prepilin peptidase)/N-methyltransferase
LIASAVKGLLFAALLVCAAVTDIRRREIDDWVWVSILAVSMIGAGVSLLGAVTTALPYFIPMCMKKGAMGGGDVKLMFACGAVLGTWGGGVQSILGLSLVVLFSLGVLFRKGLAAARKTPLPLAPFLCIGGIASYFLTYGGAI